MFVENIDPVFLRIGQLQIRYYGIIYAFGFLFCLWYLLLLSKQKKISLDEEEVYDFMIYLILGVLIGARLFEVLFYHPVYYFSNPKEIFAYWNGGMSFHGGFVGALIAAWLFIKKTGKKRKIIFKDFFYELADALMIPLALGLALGRIANFINGEVYGKITTVPWAVKFPNVEGYRHPTQIYESIKNFIIFGVLLSVRKRKYKKGFMFWLFVVLYGAMRFVIEFWKEPETVFLGIPIGQLMSAIMFVVGAIVLYKYYWKRNKK